MCYTQSTISQKITKDDISCPPAGKSLHTSDKENNNKQLCEVLVMYGAACFGLVCDIISLLTALSSVYLFGRFVNRLFGFPSTMRKAMRKIKNEICNFNPDIIFCPDRNAFDVLKKYYIPLNPKIPVSPVEYSERGQIRCSNYDIATQQFYITFDQNDLSRIRRKTDVRVLFFDDVALTGDSLNAVKRYLSSVLPNGGTVKTVAMFVNDEAANFSDVDYYVKRVNTDKFKLIWRKN